MDELRLAEAFALLERVDLLIFKLDLFVEASERESLVRFFEDWHAERNVAFDDHVDGGCAFALAVDDSPFVEGNQAQGLAHVSDDLALLHWILQHLLEDVQCFQALRQQLAS